MTFQMCFKSLEEANQSLTILELNLGIPDEHTTKWDFVKEFKNYEHQDYIDGFRACFWYPDLGYQSQGALNGINEESYEVKQEDYSWYEAPYIPEEREYKI
jgi:hypothetical protein